MVIVNPWITLLSFVYFIVAGFGAFIFAVWDVMGSVTGIVLFANAAAIAVVLGGTIASTLISYEGRYVRKALGTLIQVFVPTSVNAESLFGTVEQVIKWGKVGARDGLLALESEFKQIETKEDPFLAHCVQLFLSSRLSIAIPVVPMFILGASQSRWRSTRP